MTIEGRDTGEEMDRMKAIEKLPHVLGAAATFQIEDGKIVRQWGFAFGETPPFDNALTP